MSWAMTLSDAGFSQPVDFSVRRRIVASGRDALDPPGAARTHHLSLAPQPTANSMLGCTTRRRTKMYVVRMKWPRAPRGHMVRQGTVVMARQAVARAAA